MTIWILGATLLAFGLVGLRIMARRSVSLALLRSLRDGADLTPPFEAAVASRLDDAERHGLIRAERGRLVATDRGRRVASWVAILRRLFGVP